MEALDRTLNVLWTQMDAFFIFFFRQADNPVVGYFIGIAVLSLVCVVAGEWSIALVYRLNRSTIERDNREMVRLQNLSIAAIQVSDKETYRACNQEANDAFGKVFFSQVALGSASLWPVPFAMAWMQGRFGDVEFLLPHWLPGVGDAVGYAFSFLPMYILVRILFGKIRHRLPYFGRVHAMLRSVNAQGEQMRTFSELFSPRRK